MEAFFVSTIVVGLAEIGDKTQILSLMLAARFLRPVPIIFGILFATIANHAAAGLAGAFFGGLFSGPWTRWILGFSFLSVAVWALFPDKYEGGDRVVSRSGAFTATLCAFFIAEIGDKTQLATIGLAARFEQFYPVVIGNARHDARQYSSCSDWRPDSQEAAGEGDPHNRRCGVCRARHPDHREGRWVTGSTTVAGRSELA